MGKWGKRVQIRGAGVIGDGSEMGFYARGCIECMHSVHKTAPDSVGGYRGPGGGLAPIRQAGSAALGSTFLVLSG